MWHFFRVHASTPYKKIEKTYQRVILCSKLRYILDRNSLILINKFLKHYAKMFYNKKYLYIIQRNSNGFSTAHRLHFKIDLIDNRIPKEQIENDYPRCPFPPVSLTVVSPMRSLDKNVSMNGRAADVLSSRTIDRTNAERLYLFFCLLSERSRYVHGFQNALTVLLGESDR